MNDKILDLNIPGLVVEMSKDQAAELGAFEEDALSEADAQGATEEQED